MSEKNNERKELIVLLSITVLIVAVFSFVVFGITGLRMTAGIIFISLPFYFILNNFKLTEGEKIVFSILLGLTAFSSLAYIIGLFISFRIAIIASFVLLIFVAFGIRKYNSNIRKN